MSIGADEFDKHKNPLNYIIDYLRNNSDRAFTAESIAKEIGLDVNEVTNTLMWEAVASAIDRTYQSPIERAVVKGVLYFKYKTR
jgi:DNA-directed RNA polymerase specialized sigma subunit